MKGCFSSFLCRLVPLCALNKSRGKKWIIRKKKKSILFVIFKATFEKDETGLQGSLCRSFRHKKSPACRWLEGERISLFYMYSQG